MFVCVLVLQASAQQGWLPLSRVVDMPYAGTMRKASSDPALHSAVRPYLREDLANIPGADTLLPHAWKPWLDSLTDPRKRVFGVPLVEALMGASPGEKNVFKMRSGLGGSITWNATKRWTLNTDIMVWGEVLPNYLDSFASASSVAPGEGYVGSGDLRVHHDWNAYADYKAGKYFHFTLGRGKNFIGEGLRSLFLSDNAYSYPYLKITTSVWKVRYVNLFGAMSDIRGTGGRWNEFDLKFTSMHYLSWNALKRLNVGIFEAIVWQDNDPSYRRGFDVNYLNPVLFYRPAEFGVGSSGQCVAGLRGERAGGQA